MERVRLVFKGIEKGLSFFEKSTLFLSVMIALVSLFLNVVLRYGFSYNLAWSEELVRLVIIYTTFIGASVAVKQGTQIKIDAVVQFFPKTGRFFEIVAISATIIMACLLIKFGFDIIERMNMTGQSTITLGIPMSVIYSVLPLSGFLMIFRSIGRLTRLFN